MCVKINVIIVMLFYYCTVAITSDFFACHDDPFSHPRPGIVGEHQFTWLGLLQYIEVKTGNPHYFKEPRVVLINRQFALSTAADAAKVPEGYALGNVVFPDYDRDERQCEITMKQLADGDECKPAVLFIPIADVLLHPEYKHFRMTHSVALLKLLTAVKSEYMVPLCLPVSNYLIEPDIRETIYHVDFTANVPRDFPEEDKQIFRLNVYQDDECHNITADKTTTRGNINEISKNNWNRIVCSSGCMFHSGGPTVVHERLGHWTLVALSTGSSTCPDPLIPSTRQAAPPQHLVIQPYVQWITTAISGKSLSKITEDDPFGYTMLRSPPDGGPGMNSGWVGRWWWAGQRCFDRGSRARDIHRFYQDLFTVTPHLFIDNPPMFNYTVEIVSKPDINIICVKIGLPFKIDEDPEVIGLDTFTAKVYIPIMRLSWRLRFVIFAYGSSPGWTNLYNKKAKEYAKLNASIHEQKFPAMDFEYPDY